MSRTTKLYKSADLNELLSLIQNTYDNEHRGFDPLVRAGRLVKELHDNGWKIVKMDDSSV